jgi:phosphoribosylformimino-5-aminoimidazole carboxamide ribotide isomerase
MAFRPCIDIHNGKVRQIVGGSLKDKGDVAEVNFTSELSAKDYALLYKNDGLVGGHIILLNPVTSEYYEETKRQAIEALQAYPNKLQIGGGITSSNAREYIEVGASHVIVTSYVFKGGKINWINLKELVNAVGKEHIVIDLSCRKRNKNVYADMENVAVENKVSDLDNQKNESDIYYIVTDRWQKFTTEPLTFELLDKLSEYCDEFLVHGVDSEGKSGGMEETLVKLLADWKGEKEIQGASIPVTYAGGIASEAQLERFREVSKGRLSFTIGSALDIFGGRLKYDDVKNLAERKENGGE